MVTPEQLVGSQLVHEIDISFPFGQIGKLFVQIRQKAYTVFEKCHSLILSVGKSISLAHNQLDSIVNSLHNSTGCPADKIVALSHQSECELSE
jgi:hypothetical protein